MSPCKTAVTLFFFPLMFGALVGWAVVNSALTALEDAQRERRERVTQVTRPGGWYEKRILVQMPDDVPTVTTTTTEVGPDAETRYFVYDTHERGPVIETISDGGESVRSEN